MLCSKCAVLLCAVVQVCLCLCKNLLTRVSYLPRAASISSADRGVPVSRVIGVSLYCPVVQLQEVWSLLFLPSCSPEFTRLSLSRVRFSLASVIVKYPGSQPSCVSLDLAFLLCQGHTVSPTLTFLKRTF